MNARQATVFAAIEATGLTKSDIARIAGTHRSQVSRWTSGEQRPSYERTMRLAAYVRPRHPGLADELLAATAYGPVEVERESIPPDVLAAIRRRYPPEQQQQVIDALEAIGPPQPPSAAPSSATGASGDAPRRAG